MSLFALALALAAPVQAGTAAPAASSIDPASRDVELAAYPGQTQAQSGSDQAYDLARFLNSEERAEQLWAPLLEAMPALLAEAPETAALVQTYPGDMQAFIADAWPGMTNRLRGQLPVLWGKIAAVYRQRLSPDESSRLLAYYSSPANVRLTREILRRLDLVRAIDGQTQQVDRQVARSMAAEAYPLALATLSAAEREQVLKFKASPLAVKYAGLTSEIAAARASWFEEIGPAIDVGLDQEVERITAEKALKQ